MEDNVNSCGVTGPDPQLTPVVDGIRVVLEPRWQKTNWRIGLADAKMKNAPTPHEATMISGTTASNEDARATIPDTNAAPTKNEKRRTRIANMNETLPGSSVNRCLSVRRRVRTSFTEVQAARTNEMNVNMAPSIDEVDCGASKFTTQ